MRAIHQGTAASEGLSGAKALCASALHVQGKGKALCAIPGHVHQCMSHSLARGLYKPWKFSIRLVPHFELIAKA